MMALFFGALGVLCAAVLLPVVCVLWTLGSPVVTDVTARALGLALVQGAWVHGWGVGRVACCAC